MRGILSKKQNKTKARRLGDALKPAKGDASQANDARKESIKTELKQLKQDNKKRKQEVDELQEQFSMLVDLLGNIVGELDGRLMSRLRQEYAQQGEITFMEACQPSLSVAACQLPSVPTYELLRYLSKSFAMKSVDDDDLDSLQNRWFDPSNELPRAYCNTKDNEMVVLCRSEQVYSDYCVFEMVRLVVDLLKKCCPGCLISVCPVAAEHMSLEWSYAFQVVLSTSQRPVVVIANGTDYFARGRAIRSGPKTLDKYLNDRKKYAHCVRVRVLDSTWCKLDCLTDAPCRNICLLPPTDRELARSIISSVADAASFARPDGAFSLDDLCELEFWLRTHSFVEGVVMSDGDRLVLEQLEASGLEFPPVQYPYTHRWMKVVTK